MVSRSVTLQLSSEQEETIKALIAHNDWDYKELPQDAGKVKKQRSRMILNSRARRSRQEEQPLNVNFPPVEIQNGECEYCFQEPCVTSRRHAWLGSEQGPCDVNSAIRRSKYSNYWKVMSNLGAWNDPRYIAVKIARADGGKCAVQHRREVMPKCILRQLRTLYPNPKDRPYMDHKWE